MPWYHERSSYERPYYACSWILFRRFCRRNFYLLNGFAYVILRDLKKIITHLIKRFRLCSTSKVFALIEMLNKIQIYFNLNLFIFRYIHSNGRVTFSKFIGHRKTQTNNRTLLSACLNNSNILTWSLESFSTNFAFKRTVTCVNEFMWTNFGVSEELFVTNFASEAAIVCVP